MVRHGHNYDFKELASIPSARDMWAILAESPGITMARIDVGGSAAGTQSGDIKKDALWWYGSLRKFDTDVRAMVANLRHRAVRREGGLVNKPAAPGCSSAPFELARDCAF